MLLLRLLILTLTAGAPPSAPSPAAGAAAGGCNGVMFKSLLHICFCVSVLAAETNGLSYNQL